MRKKVKIVLNSGYQSKAFSVREAWNTTEFLPGTVLTIEQVNRLIQRPNIEVKVVAAPR